jgi:HTH-type transcriptional regulator/antitoxin HigA
MITNERRYKITKTQLRGFEQALAAAEEKGPGVDVHPRIHQAMQEGLESQITDLKEQIGRYEDLKAGRALHVALTSIVAILPTLIEARIAAGLTQKALSELLGVAEQQVQRWEATTYSGVSVERVQEVADAVGLSIKEEVTYGRVLSSQLRTPSS